MPPIYVKSQREIKIKIHHIQDKNINKILWISKFERKKWKTFQEKMKNIGLKKIIIC